MSLVPNLSLLCDMVWHDGSKRYFGKNEYRGTVSQVLRDLRDNAGPILDALVGLDVNHYVEQGRSLVIDLTTLAPSLTCILIDLIVSQLLVPRILTRHMVDTTEVLLVIDEADTICSIRANEVYPEGFSPLATYLKQGREFGLMACLSVTHLANVDLMIRANPTYHLYFSQPDPRSLLEASRSLGLEQGGERQLMALAPGQCLYLAAPSELPIPILMQVDHVAPSRDTRPQNHDRHPLLAGKRLREFPALKAVLDRWLPPSKVQTTIQSQNNDAPENTATLEGETRLLPQAQKLLHLAAVHPHYPVARCWDKADKIPIPEIQKQVWQQLQAAKLADFSEMRIGRRNQLLIELTASGWAHVGSKVPHDGGGGKLEHKQPCHWIRMTFEKTGHEVHIEWTVPGTTHRADVAVRRRDGLWDTYEVVATSYENLELHIRNCFEQSNLVARLTIVVAQQQIARQVEKQLHANSSVQPHLDRVNIDVIENYMKGIF